MPSGNQLKKRRRLNASVCPSSTLGSRASTSAIAASRMRMGRSCCSQGGNDDIRDLVGERRDGAHPTPSHAPPATWLTPRALTPARPATAGWRSPSSRPAPPRAGTRQQLADGPPLQLRALLQRRAVPLGRPRLLARHVHRRREDLLREDPRRHEEARPQQLNLLRLHLEAGLLAHLLRRPLPQALLALVLRLQQPRDDLLHPQVRGPGSGTVISLPRRKYAAGRRFIRVSTSSPDAPRRYTSTATASSRGRSTTSTRYTLEPCRPRAGSGSAAAAPAENPRRTARSTRNPRLPRCPSRRIGCSDACPLP